MFAIFRQSKDSQTRIISISKEYVPHKNKIGRYFDFMRERKRVNDIFFIRLCYFIVVKHDFVVV